MHLQELRTALLKVPGIHLEVRGDELLFFLDRYDDGIRLAPEAVASANLVWSPNREPALELYAVVASAAEVLIIAVDDVVFAPLLAGVRIRGVRASVALPDLVAYSEMLRECEALAVALEIGHMRLPGNEEKVAGSFLKARSFIVGAKAVGLAPVHAVAWWERAWAAAAPFFPELEWEGYWWWRELASQASRLTQLQSMGLQPIDHAVELRTLAVRDFEVLLPRFSVVGLDEELVSIWQLHVSAAPRHVAAAALDGLPYATATMHLYPEGGGGLDVRHPDPEGWTALLQLSFSSEEQTMSLDEVRIPDRQGKGLFKRFLFNAERVASFLNVTTITVHATGVGSYAFARGAGYGSRRDRRGED